MGYCAGSAEHHQRVYSHQEDHWLPANGWMRIRFHVPNVRKVLATPPPHMLNHLPLHPSSSLLAAQAAVPRHEMAVVTGVRNFVRIFGSTIALAICASLVNNTLRTAIRPLGLSSAQIEALVDDPTIINRPAQLSLDAHAKAVVIAGYTKGFRSVFYLTVACILVAFLASVLLVEQHELNRDDDQELKRQAKEGLERKKMGKKGEKDLEAGVSPNAAASEKD